MGAGLTPGSRLGEVSPTTPSAAQSLAAIAIYSAIFLVLTLVTVRLRDVTD